MKYLQILLIIIFISCSNKSYIPDEEMKIIIWEMMYSDQKDSFRINDSVCLPEHLYLFKEVLNNHHLTQQEFTNNYYIYLKNPIKMKVLLDSVSAYGNRKLKL